MSRIDPSTLSQMLANNVPALVDALGFPMEGRARSGDRLGLLNFVRGERNAGSFFVHVSGPKQGKWVDYVDPDNLRGDALALVHYTQTGQARPSSTTGWRVACEWAMRWLGIAGGENAYDGVAAHELVKQREVAASQRAVLEALEAEKLEKARKQMHARWIKADALHPQSRAWGYLAARGIDLAGMEARADLPGAIRTEPEGMFLWDGETKKATTWPTMICGLWRILPDGKQAFAGVHITFLSRDGTPPTKAPVKPVRKLRPAGIAGAFIPIQKGADGLSTGEWIKKGAPMGKLIVTEGVEDALTQAMMYPDVRVWAAGSVWNMGALNIPPHVHDVVLVGDNDEGREAKRAFENVCVKISAQLRQAGRPMGDGRLTIRRAAGYKDFNDALMAKIARGVA
ncbi:MAG: hypothetical protein RLZZ157_77 [Pseudomonadota bacterium]|jgi:hypothetical protein